MASSFRSINYIQNIRDILPELQYVKNNVDIGHIHHFPTLKNIILLDDKKEQGMINYADLP